MENRTQLGTNRTGLQVSPLQMKKAIEITELTQPSSQGDETSIDAVRAEYIAQADPIGTVPPPLTVKGMAKSGMNMLKGARPQVFIDKLGERLAFERTGTRLYEAFIAKCAAPHDGPDVVSLDRLRHFLSEEEQHFMLVKECLESLGADPTAQTPCADVAAVESTGLMQVITDPRTTVNQALHAILVAELTDNAAWDELVLMSREMGLDDMASRFEEAASNEQEHLQAIRQWHQEATMQELKIVAH
jgi:bacterioferritin (cytochrome b1)